jgi:primase-polymerase (primpol)-like protein
MSQYRTKNIKDLKERKEDFAKWHDFNYVLDELTEIRYDGMGVLRHNDKVP